MKPAILRALHRELTSDASAPCNLSEAEIDDRVRMVLVRNSRSYYKGIFLN